MINKTLNIIHLISLMSIINGLIFCCLLLSKVENKKANRFLCLVIFSLSFTLATPVLIHLELFNTYAWLNLLPFWLILWTGPAFYFYCKNLTDPSFVFKKKDFWHFSLILLNYLPFLFHTFITEASTFPFLHAIVEPTGIYAIIAVFAYVYFSYRNINVYHKSILNNVSTMEGIQLNWLKKIIITITLSFVSVSILLFLNHIFHYTLIKNLPSFYMEIIPIIISFLIYWLSIKGYLQSQVTQMYYSTSSIHKIEFTKNFLSIAKRLQDVMHQEKIYKNPNLTLNLLSEYMQLPERSVSISINQCLNKNFYTFINEYRVEYVKEKLSDIKYQHLKIVSIAYDSGFNSKATFNRIFKEYTGNTPNFYRPKS